MNYEEAIKSAYQHHKVTDMSDIINALHYAQKEHELLGLYRKLDRNIDHLTCSQIAKLDDEIDELEKELEKLK